ncbi:zinc finger protein ichor [Lycorma delicatula]|uniref:zinc finger protein ichor n=1 Tax=Lycorma delicatula TaxID=130591 RepID=UPI003F5170B8
MKYPGGDSEVLDPLLLSGWTGASEHFLADGTHKLDPDDEEDSKAAMDEIDLLFTTPSAAGGNNNEPNNNSLAELKPLAPFNGYTGHLSINGIPGHHYHAIAAAPSSPRVSVETNNNSSETADQNTTVYYTADQVVSSSTMDLDAACIKTESVDYNSLLPPEIEDIAAIIGSAIADTTVQVSGETSRDSWMDLDMWIDSAVNQSGGVLSAESLQDFVGNLQFAVATAPQVAATTTQSIYQHIKNESGYMPLLQRRLQNGPPKQDTLAYMVTECSSPSSSTTTYLAHSPPGHVVSTSDLQVRYNPVHSSTRPSPELQVSFPHTTTPGKKSKSRNKNKTTAAATSTVVYSEGALGKEKPVHRCTICNRGFLNKSNIKVHLRTHTGEKPFRCEVCGKAFRQKAHLIKHAQIHKRIGRD